MGSPVPFWTLHFIVDGGDQTVRMTFNGTLFTSAMRIRVLTTGFCLFQSASCPVRSSAGGQYSFRQMLMPRSSITCVAQESLAMLADLPHQTSMAPKKPKPSIVWYLVERSTDTSAVILIQDMDPRTARHPKRQQA